MAFHTAVGYCTGVIPITERHGVTSKVTGIITCELAYVATKVFDGVDEQFNNVLIAVSKRTGILDGNLVVVGSLEQASCPIGIILAISTHEVGICGCIIFDLSASSILGIGLNLGEQSFLQALYFIIHAFFFVAIAIVIPSRSLRLTDVLEATFSQDAIAMAQSALLNLYLESMRIVAADTGIVTIYMRMFGIIDLAFVLISTFDLCAVKRGGSGVVMDIAETELDIVALIILDGSDNCIGIRYIELCYLRID